METSDPRLDKSEMVGLEQRPIGLFSTKTHIKDDIAKKEKGYLIISQCDSLHNYYGTSLI